MVQSWMAVEGNLTNRNGWNRHDKLQTMVNKDVQTAISCPMLHTSVIQFLQGSVNEPCYPYTFRYWIWIPGPAFNGHEIRSPVSEAAVVRNQSLSNCSHSCPFKTTTWLLITPSFNKILSRFKTRYNKRNIISNNIANNKSKVLSLFELPFKFSFEL